MVLMYSPFFPTARSKSITPTVWPTLLFRKLLSTHHCSHPRCSPHHLVRPRWLRHEVHLPFRPLLLRAALKPRPKMSKRSHSVGQALWFLLTDVPKHSKSSGYLYSPPQPRSRLHLKPPVSTQPSQSGPDSRHYPPRPIVAIHRRSAHLRGKAHRQKATLKQRSSLLVLMPSLHWFLVVSSSTRRPCWRLGGSRIWLNFVNE